VIYIVGGRGFVGSGVARYCATHELQYAIITRENYQDFVGTSCDVLINANGNSRKYFADRDPTAEFDQSVRSVAVSLASFVAETYVLISTGDVYNDQVIDTASLSRYGLHKYLAEQLIMGAHPNWLVIRCGGFIGPGIKKNAVFDILTGAKVWLSPDSALQFIHTDHAAEIILGLVSAGVRRHILNLGGAGAVRLGDLHHAAGSVAVFDPQALTVRYELSLEKLTKLSPVEVPVTRNELSQFISTWPSSGEAHDGV
jgi:nucleoside-diphosphate-sugar epimerase